MAERIRVLIVDDDEPHVHEVEEGGDAVALDETADAVDDAGGGGDP